MGKISKNELSIKTGGMMKRRKIQDTVSLPKEIVFSLIRIFTEKFGIPKRYRHVQTKGYTQFNRYTFTWNLSNKRMIEWSSPPRIQIRILNNAVFQPNSKNPASRKLYKKKSKVAYFGYNEKAYKIYTEIMDKL